MTLERLFEDGDLFFVRFCEAIEQAQHSVALESYIFDQDALGDKVITALGHAAKRGVDVRVLLDGVGSSAWSDDQATRFRSLGIKLRFFHPLPWQRHRFHFWNYLTVRRLLLGIFKLNHRNHRKCCIIDGTLAFVGSMNVSGRHLKSLSGEKAWRDTAVEMQNAGVPILEEAFNAAWEFSQDYFSKIRRAMKLLSPFSWIQINHSEIQSELYRYHLTHSVETAEARIWITNPYFVPSRKLLRELGLAAKRGVDVKLLFPGESDFFPVQYAAHSFYSRLLADGVQIFEYQPSVLHAKILLIDAHGTVGSSNLNHRSIFMDLEADVILTHADNIERLRTRFLEDLKVSRQIDPVLWAQRSLWEKFLERVFLLFRGIL